ncbi:hypothetical protein SAMN04515671_1923 [Nakamurella panacisegetis]|uniref:Uncharacterized protein n=1 Tax=Nakamurella panacisegetis TaxID=1090615 RepID=A0A1H0M546_9ACTN|nr:hypothetical protein [Nakamurella panacisegetis]SDO75553.1 hypothetical protein SAMN04515671_1923 [Nakamurella panacisegetis]
MTVSSPLDTQDRIDQEPLDPATHHRAESATLLRAALHAVGSQAQVAVAAAAAHASLAIAEEMRTANLIEAFRIPKVTDESSKATLQIVAARLALKID